MSQKLSAICRALKAMDVITTSDGRFVVCCEIKGADESRYAIGEICPCGNHCERVFPYSFAWDEVRNGFCDSRGVLLPGWSDDVTVERSSYNGVDKNMLGLIVVAEELPDGFDHTNDARCQELIDLIGTLRGIIHLSPSRRIAWHSVMGVLGIQLSEVQLMTLSSAFTPAPEEALFDAVLAMSLGGFGTSG